ncbi:hypothetical protein J6TS2_21530 [Heyndrickxia sporothermodurans]|nr:hypothetical protein J6TS2_21530 [Heyndrickxia sporothermodurans]
MANDVTNNSLEASGKVQESLKNTGDAIKNKDYGGALYGASNVVKYGAQVAGHESADQPIKPGPRLANKPNPK